MFHFLILSALLSNLSIRFLYFQVRSNLSLPSVLNSTRFVVLVTKAQQCYVVYVMYANRKIDAIKFLVSLENL